MHEMPDRTQPGRFAAAAGNQKTVDLVRQLLGEEFDDLHHRLELAFWGDGRTALNLLNAPPLGRGQSARGHTRGATGENATLGLLAQHLPHHQRRDVPPATGHDGHCDVPETRRTAPLARPQFAARTFQNLPGNLRATTQVFVAAACQDTEATLCKRASRPLSGFVGGDESHPPTGGLRQGGSQLAQQAGARQGVIDGCSQALIDCDLEEA